jgi:hypothetical protein
MGLFTKNKQEEPLLASIPDFNPVDSFPCQANKPIYTNIDYRIRYSPDGIFETDSPVIWQDSPNYFKSIKRTYVSPDANYLIVFQRNRLFILTKHGQLVDTIKNAAIGKDRRFDTASVQWSSDQSTRCTKGV